MPGTIRIPLTAAIHLLADDIVIRLPYEEAPPVLEGRDVNPQLKVITDEITALGLLPTTLSSRPYALTFEVDQTEEVYGGEGLKDTIDQIEATVLRICRPLPSAEVIHSEIETFHKDGG